MQHEADLCGAAEGFFLVDNNWARGKCVFAGPLLCLDVLVRGNDEEDRRVAGKSVPTGYDFREVVGHDRGTS